MSQKMLCEEFNDRFADLLERDVDEATRAALESHALACADCGSLLADVRKLRIDASNLPELAPSRDLWEGIAQRIDAPVIPLRTGDVERSRRVAAWRRWVPMAAAAVLLIAVTSTSTYYLTMRHADSLGARAAATPPLATRDSSPSASSQQLATAGNRDTDGTTVPSPEPTPRAATTSNSAAATIRLVDRRKLSPEQVYASEIARLRVVLDRRRAQLDPVTISVIERNLKVIDEAIAQCKVALAKDPASRFLMESLNNALENKVELLRTATMLPARS